MNPPLLSRMLRGISSVLKQYPAASTRRLFCANYSNAGKSPVSSDNSPTMEEAFQNEFSSNARTLGTILPKNRKAHLGDRPTIKAKDDAKEPLGSTTFNVKSKQQRTGIPRQTMRAWQLSQFGGIDSLQMVSDAKIPHLSDPFDVIVQVHAASVNPFDVKRCSGFGENVIGNMRRVLTFNRLPRLPFVRPEDPLPIILGRDFSGIVVDAGKLVKNVKIGQEIYGVIGPHRQGAFAEYASTSTWCVAPKPESVSHVEAASLPYVACTTWSTLKLIENLPMLNRSETRVLVIGSGGIGCFALQYLRSLGVQVTAVCGTDTIPFLSSLGVDDIIDYQTCDVEGELQQRSRYDVILEASGGDYEFTQKYLKGNLRSFYVTLNYPLLENMDAQGTLPGLVKTGLDFSLQYFKGLLKGNHTAWAFFTPNGRFLEELKEMVDSKQIIPVVDKVFDFNDLPEACRYMDNGGLKGKVVVQIRQA